MEIHKNFARLFKAKKFTEEIVRKGYPHLKMWEGMLKAVREEVKKTLEELGGSVALTETTELVLESSERENFSQKTILEALGEAEGSVLLAKLREQGCFRKGTVISMVERTKKNALRGAVAS